jgi:hypothetical protein
MNPRLDVKELELNSESGFNPDKTALPPKCQKILPVGLVATDLLAVKQNAAAPISVRGAAALIPSGTGNCHSGTAREPQASAMCVLNVHTATTKSISTF